MKIEQLTDSMFELSPPSQIYALFIQETWLEFQMKSLKYQIPYDIDTPKDLIDALQ